VATGTVRILAIIETAKGVRDIDAIARATPRLRRLLFGAVDLSRDLGTPVDEESVASQARFAIACASRAAGLEPPMDAPLLAIEDEEHLRASARRAQAQGFRGKLCIHPAQIAIVNAAFSPSAAEVERARNVVAAFEEAEKAGRAALVVDGEMVDYPVVERARQLIAMTHDRNR
jgi:citrate lyase subunit beta/citryl-CoA lyase